MTDRLRTAAEQHLFAPLPRMLGGQRLDLLYGGFGLATLCSIVGVLYAFSVPPLQDYGDWTYQGYLLHRILTFAPAPAMIKLWPVPNSITEVALVLLGFVLSPIAAARAWIVVYLLAAFIIMAFASRDHEGRVSGAKLLLLIGLGVAHAPFWTGEINYQVGLLLLVLYVILCSRDRDPGLVFFGVYAVVMFFCHGLCLGMLLVYEGWRSLRKGRVVRLGLAILPVILLAIWYKTMDPRTELATLDTMPHLLGIKDVIGYFVYQVAKTGPYHNFFFDGMGDYQRAPILYWAGSVANLAFAGCMGVLFLSWIRGSWRDPSCRTELLTALTFILLAAVNPSGSLGIANTGERLIAPALILAVISVERRTIAQYAGASLMMLSAMVFIWFGVAATRVPSAGAVPSNGIVSDPSERFHVLFWHKTFQFAPQAEAAERAWASGTVPTSPIAFETSLLLRKPATGPAIAQAQK
jgi:hypothetical protein